MIYVVETAAPITRVYAYRDRESAARSARSIGGRTVPYVASPIESPTIEEATRLAAEWQHERDMAVDDAAEARAVTTRVLAAIGFRAEAEPLDECLRRVQRELALARRVIGLAKAETKP